MSTNDAEKKQTNLIGEIVYATINKITHECLFMSDPHGKPIRVYDFDTEEDISHKDLRSYFIKKQRLQVFIYKNVKHGKFFYGSLVLARDKPWSDNSTFPYRINDVVCGEVVVVFSNAAIVRLPHGLHGYIHLSDFTKMSSIPMHTFLEIGDHVKASIVTINRKRFRLTLSIRQYNSEVLRQETLIQNKDTLGNVARIIYNVSSVKKKQPELSPCNVLVVDDRPEVLNSIANCLNFLNANVDKAHSFEDGFRFLLEKQYNFVFIDIDLSFGFSGVDLIRQAKEANRLPQSGVFLFSGKLDIEPNIEEIKNLKVQDILYKPVRSSVLRDILNKTYQPVRLTKYVQEENFNKLVRSAVYSTAEQEFSIIQFDFDKERDNLLKNARRILSYSSMAIFERIGTGKELYFVYSEGLDERRLKSKQFVLAHTPISDLFGQLSKPIYLNKLKDSQRFLHFQDILPDISSLIGFPLIIRKKHFAIIFCKTGNKYFSDTEFSHGLILAQKYQFLLEKEKNRKIFESELTFSLFGRLVSGLNHEIRNRMQAIDSEFFLIKELWQRLFAKNSLINSASFKVEVDNNLTVFNNYINNLNDLIELFIDPITRKKEKNILLLKTIRHYMDMLLPEAEANNIRLELIADESVIPPTLHFPALALGQILTNLVLNGVQQIDKELGVILINVYFDPNQNRAIIIEVTDNSKGIHRRDFGRIFKPLYSTKKKKKGMGMGLYIARHLALANGATLELKDSFVFSGSTFRLCLPYNI